MENKENINAIANAVRFNLPSIEGKPSDKLAQKVLNDMKSLNK
jgi:hypothetical protein